MVKFVFSIVKWIFAPITGFDYRDDDSWKREHDECTKLKMSDSSDYSLAMSHSQRYYDEMLASRNAIDKKAEWLFGVTLAASAGIIGLATQTEPRPPCSTIWFPPLLFCAHSMIVSVRARLPLDRSSTVAGIDVIKWTHESIKGVEGWMAVSYYVASVGVGLTSRWKCQRVKYAAASLVCAMLWFGITLFSLR